MTLDKNVGPVHILIDYAWALLKANDPTVWDEDKYGGLVPIVPVSEEPELEQYSGPHIVYGYANDATGSLHARKSGSMTFAVYDQNFRRLGRTLNILETAFERQDESATDVNNYSTYALSSASNVPGPYVGLRFGTISVGFVEGGTPETQEGGRQSGLINIKFEYYVNYDVITKLPWTPL